MKATPEQGVAPLDIVRNKNAKNVLFAQGQMATGRAIEMRIGEMARNPGRAAPLIPGLGCCRKANLSPRFIGLGRMPNCYGETKLVSYE
jgi:hypothetical protein